MFRALFLTLLLTGSLASQEPSGKNSFAISVSFAPDSSHILVGRAEQRKIWTIGGEYDRTLHQGAGLRLEYQTEIIPFFQEQDPTITGGVAVFPNGTFLTITNAPVRVVTVSNAPIGYISDGSSLEVPIYPTGRATEKTYAFAAIPLGIRMNGWNSRRLQPTISASAGFVVSPRDLPVDASSSFNFLLSVGVGFEYFKTPRSTIRIEYLYRHMSNDGIGPNNPGVDSGVIRLSLIRRR